MNIAARRGVASRDVDEDLPLVHPLPSKDGLQLRYRAIPDLTADDRETFRQTQCKRLHSVALPCD